MGSASSIGGSDKGGTNTNAATPSAKKAAAHDENVSQRGKMEAFKNLLNSEGSRRALLRFFTRKHLCCYMDLYFETEYLLKCIDYEVFNRKLRVTLNRFNPSTTTFTSTKESINKLWDLLKEQKLTDANNNPTDELSLADALKRLRICHNHVYSLMSDFCNEFLTSDEHKELQLYLKDQELKHLHGENQRRLSMPAEGPVYVDAPDADGMFAAKFNNVLVVEDIGVAGKMLMKSLQSHGHTVKVCTNGLEALEAWRSQKFEACLIDFYMPIMSGCDLMRALDADIKAGAAHEGNAMCTIIGLSADGTEIVRDVALEAGMHYFTPKPLTIERFHELLSRRLPAETTSMESN